MKQIGINNGAKSSCGVELVRLNAKKEENAIFGTYQFRM